MSILVFSLTEKEHGYFPDGGEGQYPLHGFFTNPDILDIKKYEIYADYKAAADLTARVDHVAAILCARDGIPDSNGQCHVLRNTEKGFRFFLTTANYIEPAKPKIFENPTLPNYSPLISNMRSMIGLSIYYATATNYFDPENTDFGQYEFELSMPDVVRYVFALAAKPKFEKSTLPKFYREMGGFFQPFVNEANKGNDIQKAWSNRLGKFLEVTSMAKMPKEEVIKLIPYYPQPNL